jgi:hypothetical protein
VVVQAVGVARAVLVVLQLHQRGLGAHAEPRHDPGRGVGLHQVVDRADPGQLQDLLARRVAVHVRGERGAVVLADPVEEVVDEVQPRRGREPGAQPLLEVTLEHGPQPEQLGVPLQVVRHPGEVSVVQLLQHPERERGVVGGGARERGQNGEEVVARSERTEEGLGQRASWGRQIHA